MHSAIYSERAQGRQTKDFDVFPHRGTTASLPRFSCPDGGTTSMKRFALSAIIAFAATSALAQTSVHEEYYVVRDPATKRCTIVDQKPTVTTTIVDHGIFGTRTEAETGMKTMKVCTTDEHVHDHDD
jgi:hypothetical protein